jgi:prepilin-type processing-associated H-X9-DG protein
MQHKQASKKQGRIRGDYGDIMRKLKYQSNNDGFTLIEVLIVIFITIVLAGILLPVLSRARESGRKTQCASNLRAIGLGLTMYSNENNETFPTGVTAMTALNALYPDYVSERKAFMCPSDNLVTSDKNAGITQGTAFTKNQCSYGYDRTHGPADVSGVAIAADRPSNTAGNEPQDANSPNHGGTVSLYNTADDPGYGQNVVYVDGHVEWVASPTAGWSDANGNRDNIYTGSGSGTDTYILQDGG